MPSSSTPAFTSSSLYFAMASRVFSSGITPASVSLLALIIIMNRTWCLLLWVCALLQRRTSERWIDTATERLMQNSPRQVLFASLVGTTIEYFDFYIYGTAAVLVFPRL